MDLLTWIVKRMRETVRTEVRMLVRNTGYPKEAPTQSAATKHLPDECQMCFEQNRGTRAADCIQSLCQNLWYYDYIRKQASPVHQASSKAYRPHKPTAGQKHCIWEEQEGGLLTNYCSSLLSGS